MQASDAKSPAAAEIVEADDVNTLRNFVMEQIRAHPDDASWREMLASYIRADIMRQDQRALFFNTQAYFDMIVPVAMPIIKEYLFPVIARMLESGHYSPAAMADVLTKLNTLKEVQKSAHVIVGNRRADFHFPPASEAPLADLEAQNQQ